MSEAFGQVNLGPTGRPVSSFSPDDGSRYARSIRLGESGFRSGYYLQALGDYQVAASLGRDQVGTILSLAQVYIVLDRYQSASQCLRRALVIFPELPLANIQLRSFFGTPADFLGFRDRLRARTVAAGADANVWLALAYVEWFDRNYTEAGAALRHGAQCAADPLVMEAIESFWEGGLAGGKLSGSLWSAATAPASAPAGGPTAPQAALP
jgi:tetratricopeptide (TPR) repeat protein